jgi:hypothetical protein
VAGRPSSGRLSDLTAAFGFLLVGVAAFSPIDQRSFPGWWALGPTLGAWLVIAAGPHAWSNRWVLSHPVLVWLGLISYPLYLWHWPIFSLLRIVEGKEPDLPAMLAAIAVAVMLAGLTYQLVERPIRSQWRPRAAAVPLLLILVVAGSAGLLVSRGGGLPQRVADLENVKQFEWAQLRDAYPGRPDDDNMSLDCKSRWFADTDVNYCRLTWPDRAPDVALIGDSHANMYFSGLSAALARTNVNLLNAGKGGCVPQFDLEGQAFEPQEAGLERTCPPVVNAVLDRVLATPSIYTVILSSRDPFYKLPAEQNERDLRNMWTAVGEEGDSFMAKYARTLRDTLIRLQSAGKEVVFFLDIPLLDFNPRTCVTGRPLLKLLGDTPRVPCAVARKTFADKTATYRRVVSSILRDFPSIPVFDVANYLCDAAYCWAMKDGRMLYRDDNHLSVMGSMFVSERLVHEALN